MDSMERSILWNRLISEADIDEYYGAKKDISSEELMGYLKKYGKPYDFHLDEIFEMHTKLIEFSQSNPESINEASGAVKDILVQTMPKFLKKYPQYKGEPCIESDD